MPIIGFNFNKIEVEKKDKVGGRIGINNNVSIKDITNSDLSIGNDKQKAAKFTFEFTSKYEPDYGFITLNGDVLFLEESSKIKEIIDSWKKDKSINKDIMTSVLNTILAKCNVQALILSQEVNLPSPIPLPKVSVETKQEAKTVEKSEKKK